MGNCCCKCCCQPESATSRPGPYARPGSSLIELPHVDPVESGELGKRDGAVENGQEGDGRQRVGELDGRRSETPPPEYSTK
jgi:hypothetical protein